jgi:hypothetical protein
MGGGFSGNRLRDERAAGNQRSFERQVVEFKSKQSGKILKDVYKRHNFYDLFLSI